MNNQNNSFLPNAKADRPDSKPVLRKNSRTTKPAAQSTKRLSPVRSSALFGSQEIDLHPNIDSYKKKMLNFLEYLCPGSFSSANDQSTLLQTLGETIRKNESSQSNKSEHCLEKCQLIGMGAEALEEHMVREKYRLKERSIQAIQALK